MSTYNIGDAVPLVYTITAAATVVLTVTDPDGVTSTPSTTQGGSPPAVTYTANVAVGKAGTWLYRFVATGAVTDAEDGQFQVIPNATANVYSTLPELKTSLGLSAADTADDDDIQTAIITASRQIDGHCQRHFYKLTETRTLRPDSLWCLELGVFNDLVSVITLKTDASGDGTFETTWQTSDYQLLCGDGTPNVNAGPEPRPYEEIRAVGAQTFPLPYAATSSRRDLVQINGVWGWPQVPDAVRHACRLLAVELFKLRDAPFGAAGIADLGIIRVRDNPKAARLLSPYRHHQVQVLMA